MREIVLPSIIIVLLVVVIVLQILIPVGGRQRTGSGTNPQICRGFWSLRAL